jgi:hypothetical protein
MADPIVEQIAVKIEEAINAVTTANGFNQDLTAVRPKRIDLKGDLNSDKTVFIQQEAAAVDEDVSTTDEITWMQGFLLSALVIDSDTETDSIDIRLNRIAADILKQLLSDTYFTMGGLAEGVFPRSTEVAAYMFGQDYAGIDIRIEVRYTTDFNNPFAQSY